MGTSDLEDWLLKFGSLFAIRILSFVLSGVFGKYKRPKGQRSQGQMANKGPRSKP
jgi:hypothetical protein